MSEESEKLQILGKITGYYGVKGWLKLYSYTEPRDNIVHYKSLQIKRSGAKSAKNSGEQWQTITLDVGKTHGKGVIAHFAGYDNRETAAGLIGAELAIYRSDFKAAGKNEFYWADLITLLVVNLQGVELGQVTRLMETATHDVLVVKPSQQDDTKAGDEILIPFVLDHSIKNVDLDTATITVDWQADWNADE